jgi:hypothetical protein
MSLQEETKRRDRRARRSEQIVINDPDEVFTFIEWCALNKLSERTGRRILKRPDGPAITLLSTRRFGISRRANRAWQESRVKAGT